MTGNNNVTMSSIWTSQSRSSRHQRIISAIVSKISSGRTTLALEHNHTQFVCNALWVWKPLTVWTGAMRLPNSTMSSSTKLSCLLPRTVEPNQFRFRWVKLESIRGHPSTNRISTFTESLQHNLFRTNIHGDNIPADHQHRHGPTNQNYEPTPQDIRGI